MLFAMLRRASARLSRTDCSSISTWIVVFAFAIVVPPCDVWCLVGKGCKGHQARVCRAWHGATPRDIAFIIAARYLTARMVGRLGVEPSLMALETDIAPCDRHRIMSPDI